MKKSFIFSLAIAIILVVTSNASALSLRLSSGGTTVTCPSGTLGCIPSTPTTGGVVYTSLLGGNIGNFNVTGVLGQGPTTLGTFNAPSLDLSALTATSVGSGTSTLTIELSEIGFTGNPPSSVTGFLTSLSGTNAQAVSVAFYADTSNSLFGMGTNLGTLSGSGTFATTNSSAFTPTSNYSLTIFATITHTGKQSTSIDTAINAVPEPSTLLLFGSGLAGLGFWRWRKSQEPKVY